MPRAEYPRLKQCLDCVIGLVGFVAVTFALPAVSRAEPSQGSPYVQAYLERCRLETGNQCLAKEIKRLEATAAEGSSVTALLAQLQAADAETRRGQGGFVAANVQPTIGALKQAAERLDRQIQQEAGAWGSVRQSIAEAEVLLPRIEDRRDRTSGLLLLLNLDDHWFWLSALACVVVFAGVVLHGHRHQIRRLLGGGRLRATRLSKGLAVAAAVLVTAILALIVVAGQLAPNHATTVDRREPPAAQDQDVPDTATSAELSQLANSARDLEKRRRDAATTLEKKITEATAGDASSAWQEFRRQAMAVAQRSAVLERVSTALGADVRRLDGLNASLDSAAATLQNSLALRHGLRGGVGVGLVAIAALGGAWSFAGLRRRRQRFRDTCPFCLGRFQPLYSSGEEGEPQEPSVARCGNLVSKEPHVVCNYLMADACRPMAKLAFPTLGTIGSGKTQWLAMLYWQLNCGNFPSRVLFEKLPEVPANSRCEIDAIVEHVLVQRTGPEPTQSDEVPYPVSLCLRDHDRWGSWPVMANVFDWSGEVASAAGLANPSRRRVLEGDGYLFFLDPTAAAASQVRALTAFRDDLRKMKHLRTSKRLKVPVALCVSKIDILTAAPAVSVDAAEIARFYDELGAIDPSGQSITRQVIDARSRLTRELCRLIWPDWAIDETIGDLFGGRYLFFPLTPVGLDGCGETDLSLRTIAPFGLLEPLVWLMEMNGYRMLE
jgi:hypothetical protein